MRRNRLITMLTAYREPAAAAVAVAVAVAAAAWPISDAARSSTVLLLMASTTVLMACTTGGVSVAQKKEACVLKYSEKYSISNSGWPVCTRATGEETRKTGVGTGSILHAAEGKITTEPEMPHS